MALAKRNRRATGLLWAGLAMVGTSLVLAFATSFYAGRTTAQGG